MQCPYCGKTDSKVVDSRLAKDAITIRRRRQCLACSDRFTTYESTQERLLPFLIVKNTGQGSTIPNLRTKLSIISNTLTVLSEETEKLIDKVDKVENTHVAKESKRKAASKKKAPAEEKATSLPSSQKVVKIIKGHIQGAEEDIFEEGLDLNQAVKDYEERLILEALEKTNWVKAKAARLLHMNRTTLVEKIKNKRLSVIYEHRSQAQQSI